jgi:hypothetical protein
VTPNWYTLPDYLIEQFPERKGEIEASYLFWSESIDNPYPHVFLDEFIGPLLVGQTPADEGTRARAGAILDELLCSDDEDLAGAALTAIVEALRDDASLRADAWPFLGATARQWLERLERR